MLNLWQDVNGDMSTIVESVRRNLVQISNGRRGAGAGTIWHADGLIITNEHGMLMVTVFAKSTSIQTKVAGQVYAISTPVTPLICGLGHMKWVHDQSS